MGCFCLSSLLLVFGLSSCQTGATGDDGRPVLDEEISLKADRSHLADLRKDIPEEKQIENDEKALMLELMGQLKLHPSKVRSKWGDLVRKKREQHRRNVKKWRDEYTRKEKQRREDFLAKAKDEREDFKKTKVDREQSKRFYAEQDRKRRDFFADERDKRKDFESEVKAQSKEFDSYVRERDREFNEQHRHYSKRWADQEKQKREEKQAQRKAQTSPGAPGQVPEGVDPQFLKDFEEMRNVPGTSLAPGKSGK
ncbi:MAG: hypothetical protein KDD43_01275 [Bdellovibrionales bacterium]|nr:hypothetical protein [Bdellovibrionales bacterium]